MINEKFLYISMNFHGSYKVWKYRKWIFESDLISFVHDEGGWFHEKWFYTYAQIYWKPSHLQFWSKLYRNFPCNFPLCSPSRNEVEYVEFSNWDRANRIEWKYRVCARSCAFTRFRARKSCRESINSWIIFYSNIICYIHFKDILEALKIKGK